MQNPSFSVVRVAPTVGEAETLSLGDLEGEAGPIGTTQPIGEQEEEEATPAEAHLTANPATNRLPEAGDLSIVEPTKITPLVPTLDMEK